MDTPWWVTLAFTLVIAGVVFFFARWFIALVRDLRSGRARPDDLWPPGRTIPGIADRPTAVPPPEGPDGSRPPGSPSPPPGDDWI